MAKDCKIVRRTSIGGQAVLEGVMMKGEHSVATAVRTEAGEITVESKRIKSVKEKNLFFRLPFIRGVVNLGSQLFMGTGILLRSAEVYGDFAEPSKAEKWMADKLKINPMSVLMTISVVLGLVFAIGLFIFLPNFLTGLIFEIPTLSGSNPVFYSLTEGAFMLVIFVLYILLVSLMKDIRRVFMYHGAEHKVISCYEHGLDLTVENAKKMRTEHSRCGTTFMFLVIVVSILIFALVNWLLDTLGWLTDNNMLNTLIKIPAKLVFIPIVAGVSYELLKLFAKSDNLLFRILRAPGMWLQKLTTKQPTDDMLEVSLTAFKTVMAMDADPSMPETKFDIRVPYAVARKRLSEIAGNPDESDMDWLLVETTGKLRSELPSLGFLSAEQYANSETIAKKLKSGEPLQYALGNTEFYGIRLAVDSSLLIPRPETEELAERVISAVKEKEQAVEIDCRDSSSESIPVKRVKVLDLCTGSGAVALAVAKNTNAEVVGSDICAAAIDVAKANSLTSGIRVSFECADLFNGVKGHKFDVIASNPPYIPTSDIAALEPKVKNFEPISALDGGEDGLAIFRRIANEASDYLEEDGIMFFEFGIGQAESVKEVFSEFLVEIYKDIQGVDRIAKVKRK